MKGKISLIVCKSGESEGKEIANLCETIEWSGRRGSPTRTLKITILDDDGYGHERAGIDIEAGWSCLFTYDGEELFRGLFLKQSQSHQKYATYTAYDMGIYLSNNRDTFVYEDKTASAVFTDVCSRFGIPTGEVAGCSYVIPDLIKKKATAWDTIEDALSQEYDNTGVKYYVSSDKGKVSLRQRSQTIYQWVLDTETDITNYTYSKDMGDVKTRVILYSDEGTVLASATNSALEQKIGTFQEIDTPDETLTAGQLNSLASSLLSEYGEPDRTLTLNNVLGLTDVISGVGVFVRIPYLDISHSYYVDSDTHVFEDNKHTMDLTLNLVTG